VSRIRSSQAVAFVVRDDVRQVGLLEAGEEALSIVANGLLVALRWELEASKMKRSCHASIHCDQLYATCSRTAGNAYPLWLGESGE
jgi:hypothetical protein